MKGKTVVILCVIIIAYIVFALFRLDNNVQIQKAEAAERQSSDDRNAEPIDPKYLQYEIINDPIEDDIKIDYEKKYLVEKKGSYELQTGMRCGGFASAYLMRVLGFDANGIDTYNCLEYVMSDGSTMPDGILKFFNDRDIEMKLYYGNIEQLKTRLNKGLPLIIMIGEGESWQHYLNVVGYDEDNIYLVDSNFDTNNEAGYNRVMTNEEFNYYWSGCIKPFNNIYFYIENAPNL